MAKNQLRSSQLITTFGPGAMVDLPDDSVIIGGTDSWRYNASIPLPVISEPRLQRKLELLTDIPAISLRKPPPAIEDKGFTPDITAYRFPKWFIVQNQFITSGGFRARRLVHLRDLNRSKYRDIDGKSYPVVPVRFVRACPRGHVDDIDWYMFVHDGDNGCRRELRIEERGTSGDLDSVWIVCACGAAHPMSRAARMDLYPLGTCNGQRPWLGPNTNEGCGHPFRLLIRSASNAYFPQMLSTISIPDSFEAVDRVVSSLWESHLIAVQNAENLNFVLQMPAVNAQLQDFTPDEIMDAIQRRRGDIATHDRPVKEVEFDALSRSEPELGTDIPDGDFFARALPDENLRDPWLQSIERVVLVHRLREVVALVGFTRFEAAGPDITGELDIDVESAPLGIDSSWLPAVENRGEGIFIQFKPEAIDMWLTRQEVIERDRQLKVGFQRWIDEHPGSHRPYPGLPYFMLHSLAHLLLITISLECGYPASSLRERIYALPGRYGILIYTGSSDAEGTLGGLIEAGRNISNQLRQALELGRLCSNDPVCAYHRPGEHDHQPLLGSACHGCLLISETSCEQRNDFLDRSLVIPTVENLGAEFFQIIS